MHVSMPNLYDREHFGGRVSKSASYPIAVASAAHGLESWMSAVAGLRTDTVAMKPRVSYKMPSKLAAAIIVAAASFGLSNVSEAREQADLTLLPPHPVYERNRQCSSINAHKQYASVPLSQGEAAMCFAYSTAAMISQRVGFEVSPLDIATTFYLSDATRLAENRNRTVQRQVKTDKQLIPRLIHAQNSHDISADGNARNHPFIDKLEGGEEDAAAMLANLKPLCPEKDLPSYDGFDKQISLLDQMKRFASHASPRMNFRSLVGSPASVRKSVAADYVNAKWMEYVNSRCKRIPSPVPLLPIVYRTAEDQEDLEGKRSSGINSSKVLRIIDYALDKKRYPVIAYSYYTIQDRALNDTDRFADHSSVVVARRKSGNQCQYLVEDNSGEFCHRFKAEFRSRCEFGRVWMTEGEIEKSVYSVVYLR